jgi:CubicO group peptidase (beta-lactamase class C family)
VRSTIFLVGIANLLGAVTASAANLPKSRVDELVAPIIEWQHVKGCVVGVIDETGHRNFFAYAAPDEPLADAKTLFEIGSVTKVFTATLLAEMVEAADVKLDQPVNELLPADARMSGDAAGITLAQLATQTSGLSRMPAYFAPANPANPYADYTPALLYEELRGMTLRRKPGEEYEYSNLGVGLLGHVLALRANSDYETLLTQRVLKSLGMRDTRVTLDDAAQKRLAGGHHAIGDEVPNWDFPTLTGCGGLRSTADDMLTFLAANLELIDVPPPLRSATRATHEPRADVDPGTQIGLGWHIGRRTGARWHNGQTGGYHSFVAFVPDKKVGVVVLSNSASGFITTLGTQLVRASLGEHVEPLPRATTMPATAPTTAGATAE